MSPPGIQLAGLPPPAPEGGSQAQPPVAVLAFLRMRERSLQVVRLGAEPVEPVATRSAVQFRFGRLGQPEEVVQVALSEEFQLLLLASSVHRGLPDHLEQLVTRPA